jgi:hypothetical protein
MLCYVLKGAIFTTNAVERVFQQYFYARGPTSEQMAL